MQLYFRLLIFKSLKPTFQLKTPFCYHRRYLDRRTSSTREALVFSNLMNYEIWNYFLKNCGFLILLIKFFFKRVTQFSVVCSSKLCRFRCKYDWFQIRIQNTRISECLSENEGEKPKNFLWIGGTNWLGSCCCCCSFYC